MARIEWIDVKQNKEHVLALWSEYCSVSDHSFFLSPGWIETWIECFADSESPHLMYIEEGGVPLFAAIANICNKRRGYVIPSRLIAFNCTGDCKRDAVFPVHNHFLRFSDASIDMATFIACLGRPWDELYMPGMRPDAIPGSLFLAHDPRWTIFDYIWGNYYVELDRIGPDRESYFALLSSKTRSCLRRSYRRFEEAGGLRLRAAASADEALDMLDTLRRLQDDRCHSKKTSCRLNDHFQRFTLELVRRRFQSGEIQVLEITAGCEVVGYLYNFLYRGRVHSYQCGFKYHSDNNYRPGMVSHVEAILLNAAKGQKLYDFLAGDEHYKERLSTGRKTLVWARILRPCLKTRLLFALRAARERLYGRSAPQVGTLARGACQYGAGSSTLG